MHGLILLSTSHVRTRSAQPLTYHFFFSLSSMVSWQDPPARADKNVGDIMIYLNPMLSTWLKVFRFTTQDHLFPTTVKHNLQWITAINIPTLERPLHDLGVPNCVKNFYCPIPSQTNDVATIQKDASQLRNSHFCLGL